MKHEFLARHNATAQMLSGEDCCYIAVEKAKDAPMEVCIYGDVNQLLVALIHIAERMSENMGMPGGAWVSLMAAADVAKMMEDGKL